MVWLQYCAQYISPSVTAITSPSPTATSLNTSKGEYLHTHIVFINYMKYIYGV